MQVVHDLYKDLTLYEKIWYLKGRLDRFIFLSQRNINAADLMVESLKIITDELETFANNEKEITSTFLRYVEMKTQVNSVYNVYVNGINHQFDITDCRPDENVEYVDLIWYLRALYDEAVDNGDIKQLKLIACELKELIMKAETEEEKLSFKKIRDKVKLMIKDLKHFGYDNSVEV